MYVKCPKCGVSARKHGFFNGIQRYQCRACASTFSDDPGRLFDELRLDEKKALQVVKLLTEGVGVRSSARIVGIHPATVLGVLEVTGRKCAKLLDSIVRDIPCESVQVDELWGRVWCRQKLLRGNDPERGDIYTFLALESLSKLILSHYTGKRDGFSTEVFVSDLAPRIKGIVQITCDGWAHYPGLIRDHLLYRLNLAVMQKIYASQTNFVDGEHRYSPPACTGVRVEVLAGQPDPALINTSYVERVNLSVRTHNRRFTRLCLGFSKKLENHRHSVALWVAAHNFLKKHKTLKTTPAVAAGLTDHIWTAEELLEEATACSTLAA
jgi:transposase-like protein/IS1 family transposase